MLVNCYTKLDLQKYDGSVRTKVDIQSIINWLEQLPDDARVSVDHSHPNYTPGGLIAYWEENQ
jgi:hypothetical protein